MRNLRGRRTGLRTKTVAILCTALAGFLPVFMPEAVAQRSADMKYYPAEELTMVGKAMETPALYHRADTARYNTLPPRVTKRMTQSGGLAISFQTNSSAIYVKWCTDELRSSATMTDVAYRGLDLYIKKDGQWQYAGVARPRAERSCTTARVIHQMDRENKECLLYLPLYSETTELSIGVEPDATMKPGEQPFHHRILVYGSSIVQGASASRPGLAYPARLSRSTGLNFLNLGMGGSAKMEKEVADMIADIPADAFVLDCVPNSFPAEIRERTGYLIKTIRAKHPQAPIIVMQSVIRETGYFNRVTGEKVALQNQYIREEVERLKDAGIKNLHFIPAKDFLGHDHEGTVDGTHPTDLGFDRMLKVIEPVITKILKKNLAPHND